MLAMYLAVLDDQSSEEQFRSVYKELHADRETGC